MALFALIPLSPFPTETFLVLAALLLLQVAAAESAPSSQTCKQSSEAHGSRLVQLSQDLRRSSISSLVSETESTSSSSFNIGKAGCQCIGIDWPDGYQNLTLNGQKAIYPQSMGTSCEPWDYARHPDCKGSHSPSWCRKSWCFVDACHCDLNTLPKTSSYLPNTTFQGRKVYYSYATCGDTDEWTELNYFSSCVNQKTEADCAAVSKCAWTKSHGCLGKELAVAKGETCKHVEESVLGDDACKCIGLDVPHGSIKATIDSRTYEYPANTGAHCNSWDAETHPTCHGDNPPAWCQQKWCYVDPCSCNISVAPKKNTYVPGATSQGKPLFYSYMTCGQADSYSASLNKKACPNYGDTQSCSDQAQCAWTGSKCVLKELMGLCGAVTDGGCKQATDSSCQFVWLSGRPPTRRK